MEISNQNGLSRAPWPASTTSPSLSPGMSFEQAMRDAALSTNRMFGFNELGIFGYHAPTRSSSASSPLHALAPPETHLPPSPEDVAAAELDAVTSAPPGARGKVEEAGSMMESQYLSAVPTPAATSGPEGSMAELRTAHHPALANGLPSSSQFEAETLACASFTKALPQSTPAAIARLAMSIEGGRANVVARQYSITDEDREGLEKKVRDTLQKYGLTLSFMTLNGIASVAERSSREEV